MKDTRIIDLADGARLHARVDGPEGAPWVVMANSVLTDLAVWDGVVAALAGRCRVLRYDQRGHGRSSVPEGAMDFHRYGEDLLALMEAIGVEAASFVGLSMGVPTGLAAYAAAPKRFTRLVLVDGVPKSAPGRAEFWAERRALAREQGMAAIAERTVAAWLVGAPRDEARAALLSAMIVATPVKGFAAATHALSAYDFSHVPPQIFCPVLAIAGEKDGAMPGTMRAQFGGVADVRFATIDDAGHIPSFERPEAFNGVLLSFLEGRQ